MNNRFTYPFAEGYYKSLRYALPVIALLSAGSGHCATAPDKLNLSRASAIEMAIRRNLDVRNEALNSSMAEKDVARSRGMYNPVLTASAGRTASSFPGETFGTTTTNASLGLTQSLPTGGSISAATQSGYTNADQELSGIPSKSWQSSAGITISQPLLKNAGRETTELSITLAANTMQDSLERFRSYVTDTVLSVITSYNHLYTLRQTLESKLAALKSAQNLLDEVKKGKPTAKQRLEVANVEYAISQKRKELVDAERNVRDQEAGFRYLIGLETRTQIIPTDPPARNEPPETEDEAIKSALELRPDLKQLRLALKSSELQERVARHQSLPDLSVTASGGFSGVAGAVGSTYQQIGEGKGKYWSAGVQLSVPLGNTAAENDYRKSRIRTEQTQNQIKALQWRIRNDVEADMRALISVRLQMQTAENSLRYAEQRREEYLKHTRAGASTVQDVINAENDLTSARNAHLDAAEAFAYAVAKLWRDTGNLLDREGVHIDTSHPEKVTEGTATNLSSDPVPSTRQLADAVPQSALEREPLKSTNQAKEVAQSRPGKEERSKFATAASQVTQNGNKAENAGSDAKGATFTVMLGDYVEKLELAEARKKIRSAGLSAEVKQGAKKKEPMIRLLAGEFPDQDSARRELAKLRNITRDCFVLKNEKRLYSLYAGTYHDQKSATREQERLAAQGVKTSQEKKAVSVPTFLLTAGSFPTREAAMKEAVKLEKQGLKPVVIASGK